jgi:ribosomal protein L33
MLAPQFNQKKLFGFFMKGVFMAPFAVFHQFYTFGSGLFVLVRTIIAALAFRACKNKKNNAERIEMMKYCKWCHKHTLHKETKQFSFRMRV